MYNINSHSSTQYAYIYIYVYWIGIVIVEMMQWMHSCDDNIDKNWIEEASRDEERENNGMFNTIACS